jgi:hypothetical protein
MRQMRTGFLDLPSCHATTHPLLLVPAGWDPCHDLGVPITVTIRPEGKRVEVQGLPWDERPGSGYEVMEDAIGGAREGVVLYDNGAFSVDRRHAKRLVVHLAERFRRVHVVQYGGSESCNEACWGADDGDPYGCECSCAGANHGGGGLVLAEPRPAAARDRLQRPLPRTYDVHCS